VAVSGYSRTRRLHLPESDGSPLPKPIPENALYPAVARELAASGFTCWRDVSFLGRWIDLYARDADGELVAVEFKVTSWQRAFRQALLGRSAAHRTYVGLWAPYVHRALAPETLATFRAAGVGLLSVNGSCEVKLPAAERGAPYARYVILPPRASHHPR
jgi:hypothetical protein